MDHPSDLVEEKVYSSNIESCNCYLKGCETKDGFVERWICRGEINIDVDFPEKQTNFLGGYKITTYEIHEIEDRLLGGIWKRNWNPELFQRIEQKLLKRIQEKGLDDKLEFNRKESINYFFGYI